MPNLNLHESQAAGKPVETSRIAQIVKQAEEKDITSDGIGASSPRRANSGAEPAPGSKTSLIGTLRERLGGRSANPTANAKQTGALGEGKGTKQMDGSLTSSPKPDPSSANISATQVHNTVAETGASGANDNGSVQITNLQPVITELRVPEANRARLLLDELVGLESRCLDLAGTLSTVVQELQSGNVSGTGAGAELISLRSDVESFRKRALQLAQSLSMPAEAASGPAATLGDLRAVLNRAADKLDQDAFQLRHKRAAEELQAVLALDCATADGGNPLEECQADARRLVAEITGTQWPQAHTECLPLIERRHAYSRLLDLVREGNRLSDEEWESAEEAVRAAFGGRLAVAAVRGRLQFKGEPLALEALTKSCPTCGAELETGAKFCGECGVKIE